jgi:hypothetical protein
LAADWQWNLAEEPDLALSSRYSPPNIDIITPWFKMGYLKRRHCLGRHGKPTERLPHDPGLSPRSVERLHLASYSSNNHLMLSHSFIEIIPNIARRKRAVSVRSYGGYRAAARVGLRLGRRFLPAALAPASAPAARSARPRSPPASTHLQPRPPQPAPRMAHDRPGEGDTDPK